MRKLSVFQRMPSLELKPLQPQTKGQLIFHGGLALFTFNKRKKHHMKKLITTLALFTTPALHAGWFSSDNAQQQLQQAQAQLMQQQASTGTWQLAAGVLAVGCILLFIIGAMLGSRTRRNAKRTQTDEQ